jgi:hypothetical protein
MRRKHAERQRPRACKARGAPVDGDLAGCLLGEDVLLKVRQVFSRRRSAGRRRAHPGDSRHIIRRHCAQGLRRGVSLARRLAAARRARGQMATANHLKTPWWPIGSVNRTRRVHCARYLALCGGPRRLARMSDCCSCWWWALAALVAYVLFKKFTRKPLSAADFKGA